MSQHKLVNKLVKDPSEVGGIISLVGYMGKSVSKDFVRLYINLEFNEYLEIKIEDILSSEEVSDNIIPFGGTCIFVDGSSNIKAVRVDVIKEQAAILKGRLSHFLKKSKGSIKSAAEEFGSLEDRSISHHDNIEPDMRPQRPQTRTNGWFDACCV